MAKLDIINYKGTPCEIVPEIAPLFKTTETYAAGDHVIYEADWYTFKEAKEAGAWDATKVDGPFKVADEIDALKEDLSDLDDYIYGDRIVEVESLSKGVFESGGYGALSSTKWAYTEIFDAGTYTITPPDDWRFEIYAYNSDTSGTLIQAAYTGSTKTITTALPFIMSGRKNDNTDYTAAELEAARTGFAIIKYAANSNNLTNRVTENEKTKDIINDDVHDVNGGLVIGRLTTSTSANTDGLRTYIVPIFYPTRIKFDDNGTWLVRINRYSTFLTFNGTYIETLRYYATNCDFLVTSDTYPIYIAVGIQKPDQSEMTSEDLAYGRSCFSMKAVKGVDFTDISMFQTFGVVGDSWTAGTIYNVAHTSQITRTGQGWGENLARQSGIECANYAVGGTSVRTWYNFNDGINVCGMKGLLESDARGLYILSLGGSNDWQAGTGGARGWEIGADDPTDTTTYYMGSITDISGYNDYNDYPLTFYGYYGRIIEQIQEHAPNSRIIITSPNTYPTTSERCTACYAAVAEIAEYYGIPYMDLRKDAYFEIWRDTSLLNGLHPVASTYAGMAKAIGRLFSDVVKENWEYFREYNGDLTTVPVTWSALIKS